MPPPDQVASYPRLSTLTAQYPPPYQANLILPLLLQLLSLKTTRDRYTKSNYIGKFCLCRSESCQLGGWNSAVSCASTPISYVESPLVSHRSRPSAPSRSSSRSSSPFSRERLVNIYTSSSWCQHCATPTRLQLRARPPQRIWAS